MLPFLRHQLFVWVLACNLFSCASAIPYSEYILAPAHRNVTPSAIYTTTGHVVQPTGLVNGSFTQLIGNSSVTLDFGKEIAGSVRFNAKSVSGENEHLGFTFTESSTWISPYQCHSATAATRDDPQWYSITSAGSYAAEKEKQRGGFRYMTIWHNSTGMVTLDQLSVNFTASPEMDDLQDYHGYFNTNSEKLNRVWYAGAYTNQMVSIDPAYGLSLGVPGTDWGFNTTIANGTSVLVDGAKRDRLVWPGDIAISAPSKFVSTGNLDAVKNGIDSLFILQQPDGRLPYAGTPYVSLPERFLFSFTYHLHTLVDLYYYYMYTGDHAYLANYWDQYKLALNYTLSQIDSSGLANVTDSNDWLRSGMGGQNIEANSIFYYTLEVSTTLAVAMQDTDSVGDWETAMAGIKGAANTRLWDPSQNLFFDNDVNKTADSLHPQDGNACAVIAGVATGHRAA